MVFNETSSTQPERKLRAARRALDLVESGMTLGLGSGSTASLWIELLGNRVRDGDLKVRAIASSKMSESLARRYGIPLITFEECESLDLVVDGADEIAPGLALIKGGGGKLLREKIVASAAKRFVIVADGSKVVDQLGKFPLPIEVIPLALPLVIRKLREIGFTPMLRRNDDGTCYVTDEGNSLLDCSGVCIADPPAMAARIDAMVGVVEHGLFLGMAQLALIADQTQVLERTV